MYMCIYMYELKLVHRYICVHACIYACIFEIMPISLYICVCVCMYVCIYILMEMFFLLFLCLYICYIYFVIILFYMEEIKKSIYLLHTNVKNDNILDKLAFTIIGPRSRSHLLFLEKLCHPSSTLINWKIFI